LAASFDKFSHLEGVGEDHADLLSADRATAALFDETVEITQAAELAAKWIINELPRALGGKALAEAGLDAARFADLIAMVRDDQLPTSAAKTVLARMIA